MLAPAGTRAGPPRSRGARATCKNHTQRAGSEEGDPASRPTNSCEDGAVRHHGPGRARTCREPHLRIPSLRARRELTSVLGIPRSAAPADMQSCHRCAARTRSSAWSAEPVARSACPAKRQPCPAGAQPDRVRRRLAAHAALAPFLPSVAHNAPRVPAALVRCLVREAHSRAVARAEPRRDKSPGEPARRRRRCEGPRRGRARRPGRLQRREIDMRRLRLLLGALALWPGSPSTRCGRGQGQLQDRLVDLCRLDALGLGRQTRASSRSGPTSTASRSRSCRSTTMSNRSTSTPPASSTAAS